MQINAIKTKIFKKGDDINHFILSNFKKIKEGDVVLITSKILSLAEGSVVPFTSFGDKKNIIKKESDYALKTQWAWITMKNRRILASAGVDKSNAKGELILLPRDSYVWAQKIQAILKRKYHIKKLGVIITDSRTEPLKAGVFGRAIGYAGIKGLFCYRGVKDIFGKKMRFSRINIPDTLACAGVFEMWEAAERKPLCIISGVPSHFFTNKKANSNEIFISLTEDMYTPYLSYFLKKDK